jgi:RNA polymerase sigma-70 factor (ECF subfamily)
MTTAGKSVADPPNSGSAAPLPNTLSLEVERLFREHNAALLRFVAAKLGSEQEAKEVAQEAYVRLLSLDHLQAISYLRAFLFKTASNIATDRLRARRSAPPMFQITETDLPVFEVSPERQLLGEQMLAILSAALAELPKKCRQAFLLHRLHGLSQSEIAVRMGLRERMVRLYMARALEHLRSRVDEEASSNGG